MQQHPVPQHIADFKFKLFGSLTARQFFTMLVPLSLAALIYFSPLPSIISFPLAFIIGGLGIFIAVVPFNGQPFDKWVVSFIKAIMSPTQRIWVKEKKVPDFLSIIIARPQAESHIPEELTSQKKQRLKSYLKTLPSENATPFDIKEQIALGDIDYSIQPTLANIHDTPTISKPPSPIIWPTTPEPQSVKLQSAPNVKPAIRPLAQNTSTSDHKTTNINVSLPNASSLKKDPNIHPQSQKTKIHRDAKKYVVHGVDKRIHSRARGDSETIHLVSEPAVKLASDTNYTLDNVIPITTPDKKVQLLHGIGRTRARKLHFAPPTNFDLSKLPIRGEKRLQLTNELKEKIDFFPPATSTQLKPQEKKAAAPPSPEVILPIEKKAVSAPVMKKPITQPIPKTIPKAVTVPPNNPGQQVQVAPTPIQTSPQKFGVTDIKKHKIEKKPLSSAEIIPLTKTPNVISGLVSDSLGAPIAGAVLVIRDTNGLPVRALKTNKLGQFLSSTPLASGDFTIETESELTKFDPITFKLEDKIIKPISIVSKGGK